MDQRKDSDNGDELFDYEAVITDKDKCPLRVRLLSSFLKTCLDKLVKTLDP